MSASSPYIANGAGISVNVNGAYGQLVVDPTTGQYVVDVNTTKAPVYGQTPLQAAFLSQKIAGIPVTVIAGALFVVALLTIIMRRRA